MLNPTARALEVGTIHRNEVLKALEGELRAMKLCLQFAFACL
jgi:hypothetical protein